MKAVGIDLATQKRPTGFCFLKGALAQTFILKTDKEILEAIARTKPDIVAIDSPLSFPKKGNLRQAEQELRKKGIRFFPPKGLASMEKLTKRAIRLKTKLKKYKVIEVFPGATKDIFGIPRKDKKQITNFLKKSGLKIKQSATMHELDAALCAFTGRLFLQGKTAALGSKKEGQIIIPK